MIGFGFISDWLKKRHKNFESITEWTNHKTKFAHYFRHSIENRPDVQSWRRWQKVVKIIGAWKRVWYMVLLYPPPNICATTEQMIRTKPASPVINTATETAGFPWTSGKLTALKAWIEDAVESPAAKACWKIVGAPSHRSEEPDTANMKNKVARYSAKMANQKST